MEEDGTFDVLPKREVLELNKEKDKLQKNLGGIEEMGGLPDMIFVVDPKKESICVQEAHTLGIPLVGIADTNCDPEELDYVIPGNDDAIRAVKLIASAIWLTLLSKQTRESMQTLKKLQKTLNNLDSQHFNYMEEKESWLSQQQW